MNSFTGASDSLLADFNLLDGRSSSPATVQRMLCVDVSQKDLVVESLYLSLADGETATPYGSFRDPSDGRVRELWLVTPNAKQAEKNDTLFGAIRSIVGVAIGAMSVKTGLVTWLVESLVKRAQRKGDRHDNR